MSSSQTSVQIISNEEVEDPEGSRTIIAKKSSNQLDHQPADEQQQHHHQNHEDKQDITDGDPSNDPITFSYPSFSYMNPKIELRRIKWGIGMFATTKIFKDEVLIGWAGRVAHISEVMAMQPEDRHYVLQIDEELFQAPFWQGYNEPADFTNHSCNPNCGFGNSAVSLVAMREINVGEELTFDYAMADSAGGCEADWDCLCGTEYCRGKIRGSDWKLPELWERYQNGDYFSPYLRRKIAALRKRMGLPESEPALISRTSTPDILSLENAFSSSTLDVELKGTNRPYGLI